MSYRICIFGNSGSGKSTLAKGLSEVLNVPVIHLDREFLTGNFQSISREERATKHLKIIAESDWIIDGNYRKILLDDRIKRANLVVFINTSRVHTLPRVLLRAIKNNRDKETIPDGANSRFLTWRFLKYVSTYNRRKYLNNLKELCAKNNIKILELKNTRTDEMVEKVTSVLRKGNHLIH